MDISKLTGLQAITYIFLILAVFLPGAGYLIYDMLDEFAVLPTTQVLLTSAFFSLPVFLMWIWVTYFLFTAGLIIFKSDDIILAFINFVSLWVLNSVVATIIVLLFTGLPYLYTLYSVASVLSLIFVIWVIVDDYKQKKKK